LADPGRAKGARRTAHRKRSSPGSPTIERFAPILLIAAGLAAYHNAFQGPFVLDDLYAIPTNESIRSLEKVFSPPTSTPVAGRPLVNLSLALNYAIGGLSPASYHVFNVLLHVLAALALFGIVRRTLDSPDLRPRYRGQAGGLAAAVALLWVVHPLTTESVDYTIQRTELLMGLFLLLTLYCAIRGFAAPEKRGWHVAALGAFALGMASKEVMIVAPLVVLAYDRLFWSASFRDALRKHARLYGGLAAVLVVSILLVATRFRRTFVGLSKGGVSPWDYALTQAGVIVHYLRLAVWPSPLVADYAGWPIATSVADVLPSLLVIGTLLALTVWGFLRRQPLAFLGVFFFLVLAPTSSFRPILTEIAAERRMYLPLAAPIALLVLGGHSLHRRLQSPRGLAVAAVTVSAAILALLTIRRNEDYRTTLAFWTDIVAKRPDNPRGRSWLGNTLNDLGREAEAFEHLTAAVRLQPSDATAHYNLAVVLASQGKTDEAIARYREALRLKPEYAPAHNNLGNALENRGEMNAAAGHFREAVRIDPSHAIAHYNLARALRRQGRREEAVEHLEAAVRLKPDFPEARRALDALGGVARPSPGSTGPP
jgi:tetratricopeptide (TPR) repeat protein